MSESPSKGITPSVGARAHNRPSGKYVYRYYGLRAAVAMLALAVLSHGRQLVAGMKVKYYDEASQNSKSNGAGQSSSSFIRTDTQGLYWTESHSPRNNRNNTSTSNRSRTKSKDDNNRVRISFRLHDPDDVPYPRKFLSVHGYTCHGGSSLPSAISGRAVLNFTTTIQTDLNILFVGDSISQQFAQGFYSSVLGEEHAGSHAIVRAFINGVPLQVGGKMYYNSGVHVCSSIVAPIRGGGVSAYWRVLELMSNRTESLEYVNCKNEKGWVDKEGKKLSNHRYPYPPAGDANSLEMVDTTRNSPLTTWMQTTQKVNDNVDQSSSQQQLYQVGDFDSCVLRMQHGWMKIHEITRERIIEEIHLCNKVVGARTVIISTLSLNNNVITSLDWEGIININKIIRDIARGWKPPASGDDGVQFVLVQEFGNLTNQILWHNAQHIGYNITMPDVTEEDEWEKQGSEFLLHRYQGVKGMGKHAPSIPMVCAFHIEQPFSTKNKTAGQCFFNHISRDGMHWCVETLGSRYSASIACLLGCVYNRNGSKFTQQNDFELRLCEQECNDQFMSLVPVHEDWIGTNATIFSV